MHGGRSHLPQAYALGEFKAFNNEGGGQRKGGIKGGILSLTGRWSSRPSTIQKACRSWCLFLIRLKNV